MIAWTFRARRLSALSAVVLCLSGMIACDDDGGSLDSDCTSTQDVRALLTAYAERAERATGALLNDAVAFDSLAEALPAQPTADDVVVLREAWLGLAGTYQAAAPYAAGADLTTDEAAGLNPFPVNEAAIEASIDGGSGDLPEQPAFDRGVPALDYLLFQSSAMGVAARLADDADRVTALRVYARYLRRDASAVAEAWTRGRDAFVAREGTAAGSGVSALINLASKHLEDLRRDKLATPAGITTLGIANPQTVEAPYSGTSLRLLRDGVAASETFLFGSAGDRTNRLVDYVEGLDTEAARSLLADIEGTYADIERALDAVETPLQRAVSEEPDDVLELYRALSDQVVNLKTDLPAVACVSITYVDNPSDSD